MFATMLLLWSVSPQTHATPDHYRCSNAISGEWNFGRAPQGCDASSFGEDKVVQQSYLGVVFDDFAPRTAERQRYMEELHAVIREASTYYMKKRKPSVSAAELQAWNLGIMATASQETFWSHYRIGSDGRLKMMRGDFGHGHGMMQVDDRAHFPAIERGLGWNLALHMAYAMDIYYAAWERAPAQSCVGSATNYTARIRAAWAAYNGGPSRICRWTNPNDTWARNDQNFLNSLNGKRWLNFIADTNKSTSIDIACLMEQRENCTSSQPNPEPLPTLQEKILYRTADRKVCVYQGGTLSCLEEERDRLCLKVVGSFSGDVATELPSQLLQSAPVKIYDRHQLCQVYDASLIPVSTSVVMNKSINLRLTPGGGILGVIPQGEVTSVLDFEVRTENVNDRYYKVSFAGKQGYVFGGNKNDWKSWVDHAPEVRSDVARSQQWIQIATRSGINLRRTPGGQLMTTVPSGYQIQVQEVVVLGSSNDVYYKVNYGGNVGYIYSGLLLPQSTVKSWTVVLP